MNKENSPGSFDVYSLANLNNINWKNKFNSDNLIKAKNVKKEKLIDTYLIYYNRCTERIESANSKDKMDIFFDIPEVIPECPNYNSFECLLFIEKKLRSQKLDTFIMNNKTIFITWKYIEENKTSDND